MSLPETLSDLRNHLYSRGESWWAGSFFISVAMLLLAVLPIWSTSKLVLSTVMVSAVLAPVVVSWMREMASACLLKGDKCRRLILFADSLGQDVPPSQIAEVRGWALGASVREATFIRPYYTSNLAPGPRRLADNIAESAFFTKLLASKARVGLNWVAGIAVCGAITVLSLSDLFAVDSMAMSSISKSVAIFVAFLASGDFALMAKKYGDLESEAQRAFELGARLRENDATILEEARTLAEEYGIALLQAPPIPSWLYGHYRDDLNGLYRESHT